jgi:AcrR family transcriptional regulator
MSKESKMDNRKKEILDLYVKKACNVSAVCTAVGISRKTFYDYVNSDEEFAELIEDAKETLLDNAESILHKKILSEDTVSLLFFLKTKGKQRGYTERTEIDNLPPSEPIQVRIVRNNTDER